MRCSRSAGRGRRRSPRPRGEQLPGGRAFSAAERGCGAAVAGGSRSRSRGADSRPPPRRYSAQPAPLPPAGPAFERRRLGKRGAAAGDRSARRRYGLSFPEGGRDGGCAGSGELRRGGPRGAAGAAPARRWRRRCRSRIRFRGAAASWPLGGSGRLSPLLASPPSLSPPAAGAWWVPGGAAAGGQEEGPRQAPAFPQPSAPPPAVPPASAARVCPGAPACRVFCPGRLCSGSGRADLLNAC